MLESDDIDDGVPFRISGVLRGCRVDQLDGCQVLIASEPLAWNRDFISVDYDNIAVSPVPHHCCDPKPAGVADARQRQQTHRETDGEWSNLQSILTILSDVQLLPYPTSYLQPLS